MTEEEEASGKTGATQITLPGNPGSREPSQEPLTGQPDIVEKGPAGGGKACLRVRCEPTSLPSGTEPASPEILGSSYRQSRRRQVFRTEKTTCPVSGLPLSPQGTMLGSFPLITST